MRIPILACLLFAAACVELRDLRFDRPSGPFSERMNGWIGRTAKELIAHFGPPPNTTTLPNGGRIFQYPAGRERGKGEDVATYDPQRRAWVVWPKPATCPTAFTVSAAGVIERWSADEADCR